jgi:hypothetical protein
MAVEVLKVRYRICDLCGSKEDVSRWRVARIENDPRMVTVDLCREHADPLAKVLEAKPVPHRKARAVTPKREVAARKRAAAKKR